MRSAKKYAYKKTSVRMRTLHGQTSDSWRARWTKTLNNVDAIDLQTMSWTSLLSPLATPRHGLGIAMLKGALYAIYKGAKWVRMISMAYRRYWLLNGGTFDFCLRTQVDTSTLFLMMMMLFMQLEVYMLLLLYMLYILYMLFMQVTTVGAI
jgi:hypothetical protein